MRSVFAYGTHTHSLPVYLTTRIKIKETKECLTLFNSGLVLFEHPFWKPKLHTY